MRNDGDGRATRRQNDVAQFIEGVGDVWRGLGLLIARPGLWFWAAVPFVLNVLLFVGVYWLAGEYLSPWLTDRFFTPESGFWSGVLGWVVRVVLWLTIVLITIFLFVPFASVIAAPFNDVLSEKVEHLCAGESARLDWGNQGLIASLWLSFKTTVKLTGKTLLLLACVLPLYLVPGVGSTLAAVLQAGITIWFISLEYTSYSMDRRAFDYRRRKLFLELNRPRTLGLGAMAFLIMMVPGLNALFIPVSAIAGTLLFCEAERRNPTRGNLTG